MNKGIAASAAAALVVGCSFSGSEGTGRADAAATDGDAQVDASPDAGLEPASCGTSGAFVDSFDTGDRWLTVGGQDITVFDGELTLTVNTTGFAGVSSQFAVDMRETFVSFEVAAPLDRPGSSAAVQLVNTNGDFAGFGFARGALSVQTQFGDAAVEDEPITPFAEATDRFFRIGASGDTLTFAISSDRATWRDVHSVTDAAAADLARAAFTRIVGVAVNMGGDNATVAFDNLNTTDVDVVPWCKAATVQDDFEDGELDPRWFPLRFGACVGEIEAGGAALLNQDTSTGGTTCAVYGSPAVDLTESSFTVEVSPTTMAPGEWSAGLGFEVVGGGFFALARTGAQLCAVAEDADGAPVPNINAICIPDSVALVFWRISMDAATQIGAEASADGVMWIPVLTPTPWPLSDGTELDLFFGSFGDQLQTAVDFEVREANP